MFWKLGFFFFFGGCFGGLILGGVLERLKNLIVFGEGAGLGRWKLSNKWNPSFRKCELPLNAYVKRKGVRFVWPMIIYVSFMFTSVASFLLFHAWA